MSAYEVDRTLAILEERALVPALLVDVGVKGPVGDKSSELSRGDSTKDRTGGADVEPESMIPTYHQLEFLPSVLGGRYLLICHNDSSCRNGLCRRLRLRGTPYCPCIPCGSVV